MVNNKSKHRGLEGIVDFGLPPQIVSFLEATVAKQEEADRPDALKSLIRNLNVAAPHYEKAFDETLPMERRIQEAETALDHIGQAYGAFITLGDYTKKLMFHDVQNGEKIQNWRKEFFEQWAWGYGLVAHLKEQMIPEEVLEFARELAVLKRNSLFIDFSLQVTNDQIKRYLLEYIGEKVLDEFFRRSEAALDAYKSVIDVYWKARQVNIGIGRDLHEEPAQKKFAQIRDFMLQVAEGMGRYDILQTYPKTNG